MGVATRSLDEVLSQPTRLPEGFSLGVNSLMGEAVTLMHEAERGGIENHPRINKHPQLDLTANRSLNELCDDLLSHLQNDYRPLRLGNDAELHTRPRFDGGEWDPEATERFPFSVQKVALYAALYEGVRWYTDVKDRRTGGRFMRHPYIVSWFLSEQRMDLATIITGFWHDIIEEHFTLRGIKDAGKQREVGDEILDELIGSMRETLNTCEFYGEDMTADQIVENAQLVAHPYHLELERRFQDSQERQYELPLEGGDGFLDVSAFRETAKQIEIESFLDFIRCQMVKITRLDDKGYARNTETVLNAPKSRFQGETQTRLSPYVLRSQYLDRKLKETTLIVRGDDRLANNMDMRMLDVDGVPYDENFITTLLYNAKNHPESLFFGWFDKEKRAYKKHLKDAEQRSDSPSFLNVMGMAKNDVYLTLERRYRKGKRRRHEMKVLERIDEDIVRTTLKESGYSTLPFLFLHDHFSSEQGRKRLYKLLGVIAAYDGGGGFRDLTQAHDAPLTTAIDRSPSLDGFFRDYLKPYLEEGNKVPLRSVTDPEEQLVDIIGLWGWMKNYDDPKFRNTHFRQGRYGRFKEVDR